MRFVYSMITLPNTDIIFISNRKKGKESKIAERQRECARDGEVASVVKMTVDEKGIVEIRIGLRQ
jgi:hypothetical protein